MILEKPEMPASTSPEQPISVSDWTALTYTFASASEQAMTDEWKLLKKSRICHMETTTDLRTLLLNTVSKIFSVLLNKLTL